MIIEKRKEAIEELKETIKIIKKTIKIMEKDLQLRETLRSTRERLLPKKNSHYDTLVSFFNHNQNEWAGVKEIIDTTGLKRHVIYYVINKSANKESFEKRLKRNYKRIKEYRLRNFILSQNPE